MHDEQQHDEQHDEQQTDETIAAAAQARSDEFRVWRRTFLAMVEARAEEAIRQYEQEAVTFQTFAQRLLDDHAAPTPYSTASVTTAVITDAVERLKALHLGRKLARNAALTARYLNYLGETETRRLHPVPVGSVDDAATAGAVAAVAQAIRSQQQRRPAPLRQLRGTQTRITRVWVHSASILDIDMTTSTTSTRQEAFVDDAARIYAAMAVAFPSLPPWSIVQLILDRRSLMPYRQFVRQAEQQTSYSQCVDRWAMASYAEDTFQAGHVAPDEDEDGNDDGGWGNLSGLVAPADQVAFPPVWRILRFITSSSHRGVMIRATADGQLHSLKLDLGVRGSVVAAGHFLDALHAFLLDRRPISLYEHPAPHQRNTPTYLIPHIDWLTVHQHGRYLALADALPATTLEINGVVTLSDATAREQFRHMRQAHVQPVPETGPGSELPNPLLYASQGVTTEQVVFQASAGEGEHSMVGALGNGANVALLRNLVDPTSFLPVADKHATAEWVAVADGLYGRAREVVRFAYGEVTPERPEDDPTTEEIERERLTSEVFGSQRHDVEDSLDEEPQATAARIADLEQ